MAEDSWRLLKTRMTSVEKGGLKIYIKRKKKIKT